MLVCLGDIGPSPEVCDGLDNDCDGVTDPGCACLDGDSRPCGTDVGECVAGTQLCTGGAWGACTGDAAPTPEVCDGLDNDCDGAVDNGVTTTFYPDLDADAFGDMTMPVDGCTAPAGFITTGGDCNDADRKINPLAAEKCDGIDDDCDGVIDNGC